MAARCVKLAASRARFDWADTLAAQVTAFGLPEATREAQLVPGRKFRTDLSWPDRLVAVEVDGGEWGLGRHGRGIGMRADCEKANALTLAGWAVFRFVGSQVQSGYAVDVLRAALT